jgi:anti-anti-sigma factor
MLKTVQKAAFFLPNICGMRVSGKPNKTVKDGRAGTTVMVLSGEYDLASREQVRAAFDSISAVPRVALDFSDVTYIDSTIIHALARLYNARVASQLDAPTLVVRSAAFIKLFTMLRLTTIFRVVDTLDEAVARDGKDITVQYASSFDGATRGTAPLKSVSGLSRNELRRGRRRHLVT